MGTQSTSTLRAVWIFDAAFAPLTFLSVSSFLGRIDIPVTLYFTEPKDDPEIRSVFESLVKDLEWIHFYPDILPGPEQYARTAVNRLARFSALRTYSHELILLLDADTAFGKELDQAIGVLKEKARHWTETEPKVLGVIEHKRVIDAGFFFLDRKNKTWKPPAGPDWKNKIREEIFGAPVHRLGSIPQFNNGVLACWNAASVADVWETYYLRSLAHPETNPADDQVPLAVALHDLGIPVVSLSPRWNSLGDRHGDYFCWHAWAGNWKIDLFRAFNGGDAKTQYGQAIDPHLQKLPTSWYARLQQEVNRVPVYYRQFDSPFLHEAVYREFVLQAKGGEKVLEASTAPGQGACLMAELIKCSGKPISFEIPWTIDTGTKNYIDELSEVGLNEYVTFPGVELMALEDETYDLICYNTPIRQEGDGEHLALLYQKLKPGGVMVGFDQNLYESVSSRLQSVVVDFCERNALACHCRGQVFQFTKPLVTQLEMEGVV